MDNGVPKTAPWKQIKKGSHVVAARKSVVIVEDNDSYRQLLNIVIELDDRLVVVGEATESRGAIDAVSKHQPDVIVLDVELADGSCAALIPQLREASPQSRIIVHSADPDTPRENLGADGCFTKDQGVLGLVDVLVGAASSVA